MHSFIGRSTLLFFVLLGALLPGCTTRQHPVGFTAEPGNTARIATENGKTLRAAVSEDFPLIREYDVPAELPTEAENIDTRKALLFMKSEDEVIVLLDIKAEQDLHFQIKPKFPETGSGWIDGLDFEYYVTNQNCMLQYVTYYPVDGNAYLAVSYSETIPAGPDRTEACSEWNLHADLSEAQSDYIRKLKQRAHKAVRVRRTR